jgi:hypothetical protein
VAEGILEDPRLDHPLKVLLVEADVNTIGRIEQDSRSVQTGIIAVGIGIVPDRT